MRITVPGPGSQAREWRPRWARRTPGHGAATAVGSAQIPCAPKDQHATSPGTPVAEAEAAQALSFLAGRVRAQPKTLGQEGSFRRVQSAGQLRRQIVDAMIPGTRTAATEKGELAPLVTVDPSLLDRLTPVFQAIGSRTVNAGAVAGSPTKPSHCGGFGKIR
jgi:hypothetical protein